MAPATQGLTWAELLCCPLCQTVFSETVEPVSLTCAHVLCKQCIGDSKVTACPIDEESNEFNICDLPANSAILSVVGVHKDTSQYIEKLLKKYDKTVPPAEILLGCLNFLIALTEYLQRTNSERGGSVWSEKLSRPIQRKLFTLLSYPIQESSGRLKIQKAARTIAERVLSEQSSQHQSVGHNVSTQLWTAVRSRGCQFLGPAMQEDVLKLILLTLEKGAQIARKTLVMYIVQAMSDVYPQVSKTCVGHVVQLLYRASCFHVVKRDGESSLMSLKEEFRTYDSLRREHDAQIVGMAIETGLRITPDQWSALLYGDQDHRSHMQSIMDRLQTPQSFTQGIDELDAHLVKTYPGTSTTNLIANLCMFEKQSLDDPSWEQTHVMLSAITELLEAHTVLLRKAQEARLGEIQRRAQIPNERKNNFIKTKNRLCRDVASGLQCPRGQNCHFAHSTQELRHQTLHRPNSKPYMDWKGSNIVHPVSLRYILPLTPLMQIPAQFHPMPMQPMQPAQIVADNQMMPVLVPVAHPPPSMTPMIAQDMNTGAPQPLVLAGPPPAPHGMVPANQMPPPAPGAQSLMMLPDGTQGVVMQAPTAVWPPQHPGAPPAPMGQPVILQPIQWMGPPGVDYSPENSVIWTPQIPGNPMGLVINDMPPGQINNYIDHGRTTPEETDHLHMKRREILNRLAYFDDDNDDARGHVSYTVASSVLDDYRSNHLSEKPVKVSVDLPRYNPASIVPDETVNGTATEVPLSSHSVASSLPVQSTLQASTVRTVCPAVTTLVNCSPRPSTIISDCSGTIVHDSITQPLPASTIINLLPVAVVPNVPNPAIPHIAPQFPTMSPQLLVSTAIDNIVDVKERLSERGPASSVESEQLRVELVIAGRPLDCLDPFTKQTCLRNELQIVEKKLEELGINSCGEVANHPSDRPPMSVPAATLSV